MSKKTLTVAILLAFFAVACSSNPNMLSPEKIEQMHTQISDANAVLSADESSDEDRAKAYQKLGISYQALGRYKKALNAYEEVLKLAPTDFVALNNSADIYENQGDLEQAKKFILVLYVYNKDNQAVVKNAIRIHANGGDTEQAMNILEEYATNHREPENVQFISDQFIFVGGVKNGATGN